MKWDRYDIIEAYYLYLSENHSGQFSREYSRLSKIQRYFSPGPMFSRESLTPNGLMILENLENNGD